MCKSGVPSFLGAFGSKIRGKRVRQLVGSCNREVSPCLQNMVDGLGVTGYEGVFIRVCEITLSVLRSHRESLMSVLETFIHDPLVEWTKLHKSSTVEVENPQVRTQRVKSNFVFEKSGRRER